MSIILNWDRAKSFSSELYFSLQSVLNLLCSLPQERPVQHPVAHRHAGQPGAEVSLQRQAFGDRRRYCRQGKPNGTSAVEAQKSNAKTALIRIIAVRETGVSWQNEGPMKGPPETPRTITALWY